MPEWSRDIPWRQGHLLSSDAIASLGLSSAETSEQIVAIVATHDCDLAQAAGGEPCVELIIGRSADKDGNYTHAKNARKLHICFNGDGDFWGEFEATSKVAIEKDRLIDFMPRDDACLDADSRNIFQIWLASRYRRSAFPDEFERRLVKETKLADKIAKAVKPHGELITGVFFDVDAGEEFARDGADDTYTLDIIILHEAENDFDAAEAAARIATVDIVSAFKEKLLTPTGQWQHIELRSCEPISEAVLTYLQFKQLKKWRLEHISLAADPPHAVLAE